MELRDIEIFLTLAEELHFGRTAERLHVTPARVSQSIKKQERRIGALLFDRSTRAVRLTPLGEQLHQELSAGYRRIIDGIEAVATAAGGLSGVLRLGLMGAQAWMVGDLLDRFRERYPAVELRHCEIQPTAPFEELRAGEVDVAVAWLPVHEPDLTVGPVTHISGQVLMAAASHPLAGRTSVCLEDLGDCTVLTPNALPVSMEAAFNPYRTPSGRPIARGPVVSSWHEEMTLVAAGEIVSAVVAESSRFYPWPDIVYIPIRDAQPCQWALIWRTARESALIQALAETVASSTRPEAPSVPSPAPDTEG
ncbi:LysR substrate-binding domain-containing protein [Kribbella sp. NPDC020789]